MPVITAQVTTETFDSTTGRLVPVGGLIQIDTELNELTKENSSNCREPGSAPIVAPVVIAAIAPTGPNPTTPQQVPHGFVQTMGGYTNAIGAPLVAEGSVAEAEHRAAAAGGIMIDEGGTTLQQEPGPLDGSVAELTAYLQTVSDPAAVDALIVGEKGGKSRVGALAALDARATELKGSPLS
jgi:hypothetical protein